MGRGMLARQARPHGNRRQDFAPHPQSADRPEGAVWCRPCEQQPAGARSGRGSCHRQLRRPGMFPRRPWRWGGVAPPLGLVAPETPPKCVAKKGLSIASKFGGTSSPSAFAGLSSSKFELDGLPHRRSRPATIRALPRADNYSLPRRLPSGSGNAISPEFFRNGRRDALCGHDIIVASCAVVGSQLRDSAPEKR
jgi:hypothetical protein